ncbi:MAG TPA: hypothetical protein PLA27_15225, partial [Anaerolineales bacterium]|nr:hypothetical protein [Anaerolineales bacterium]
RRKTQMNADFSTTRRKKSFLSAFSACLSVQKGKCQVVRFYSVFYGGFHVVRALRVPKGLFIKLLL